MRQRQDHASSKVSRWSSAQSYYLSKIQISHARSFFTSPPSEQRDCSFWYWPLDNGQSSAIPTAYIGKNKVYRTCSRTCLIISQNARPVRKSRVSSEESETKRLWEKRINVKDERVCCNVLSEHPSIYERVVSIATSFILLSTTLNLINRRDFDPSSALITSHMHTWATLKRDRDKRIFETSS